MMKTNALRIGDVALPGVPLPVFTFPQTAGLEGLHLFTDGADVAQRNWAPGKSGGTLVGSPVASDGYMRLNGSAYLQTQIPESAQMTLIAVARAPVSANCGVFGNYGGAPSGVGLYRSGSNINGTASRAAGSSVSAAVAAPVAQFAFVSATILDPGATTVRNSTSGASAASPNVGARVLSANGALRAGRFYEAAFIADVDVVFVAAFSSALTAPQLTAIYEWAKAMAAGRGITI